MNTQEILQSYHLSLSPAPRRRLRLVPIEDEPETMPQANTDYEELLLVKGWQGLGPGQGKAILDLLWPRWQALSDYQRNCLVCQALGSQPNGGAAPPWSTSLNMTRLLIERVQSDWFPLEDFADILYHLLCDQQGFGEQETGHALAYPRERAYHFFTLLVAAQQPSILAFTFVAVYRPQLLFHTDTHLTPLPRTPIAPMSAAAAL
jgi:hypothetical protein